MKAKGSSTQRLEQTLVNNVGEEGISEESRLAQLGVGAKGPPPLFLSLALPACKVQATMASSVERLNTMRHVPAHFDGEKVVLDGPVSIPPQTPLEVVIPDSAEELRDFSRNDFLASLPSLTRIWANPLDAEYDKL